MSVIDLFGEIKSKILVVVFISEKELSDQYEECRSTLLTVPNDSLSELQSAGSVLDQ